MKKLIALYKVPDNAEAFLSYFREVHLRLVEKIPGLLRAEATLIDRTLVGEPGFFLLAQMESADEQSFRAAMKSPENAAAGADVGHFADGWPPLISGTVLES